MSDIGFMTMITQVGANNLTLATQNNDKVTPVSAAVGEGRVQRADLSGVTALLNPFNANVTVVDEGTGEMMVNGSLQTVGRLRVKITNENMTQSRFVREIVVNATYQSGQPFVLIASSLGSGDDINNMLPAPSVPGVVTAQLEFLLVYFISPENYNSLDISIISGEGTPRYHASETTEFGLGDGSKFGHLKLSDATNSTLDVGNGVAATPLAVRTVAQMISGLDLNNLDAAVSTRATPQDVNNAAAGLATDIAAVNAIVSGLSAAGIPISATVQRGSYGGGSGWDSWEWEPGGEYEVSVPWMPTPITISPVNPARSLLIVATAVSNGSTSSAFYTFTGVARLTANNIFPLRMSRIGHGSSSWIAPAFEWQVISW